MSQVHPITGAVIGSLTPQRAQAQEKAAQMQRAQKSRNSTPSADSFEERVLSPDELSAISDESHRQPSQKRNYTRKGRKPAPTDEPDQSLDIQA